MFGVDIGAHAAVLLRFGDDLQRQRRLAGSFRTVNFDHPAARHTADTERDVESERTGRNGLHVFDYSAFAELHDRAFAELLFDLAYGEVDCLFTIYVHRLPPSRCQSSLSVATFRRV